MLKKIDFKFLAGSVISYIICYLTMAGIIQNYISFAGIDNEIAFAFMAAFSGGLFTFGIKKS